MMISDAEMKEELSEVESDPESAFDEADLIGVGLNDEVSTQLIAAGPVGLAAAAAIATGRRRKRGYMFETNPAIRRRQQTRLLRRLRATIDEYCVRVGQQAVVICCAPGRSKESFRTFGAKPLEDVLKNIRNVIMQDLESALAQQAPKSQHDDPSLFELPPLVIDGIPTPVDKMAQQQLRMFIPHMLKYSTGRGKPGWGREELKPPWWPEDTPWKNIRIDERPEELKQKVSWTHALRQIVKNCYIHHGREDLFPTFDETMETLETDIAYSEDDQPVFPQAIVQTVTNPDGTVSLIQVEADSAAGVGHDGSNSLSDLPATQILNVSSVQQLAHDNTAVVTLQDGTVHHISSDGRSLSHHPAISERAMVDEDGEAEFGIEATIDSDGQIVVTGDCSSIATDGGDNVLGMLTIPVSRYHQMINAANGSSTNGFYRHVLEFAAGKGEEVVLDEDVEEGPHIVKIEAAPLDRRKRMGNPDAPIIRTAEGQQITIEGSDGSYTFLPADKIELIDENEETLLPGSFQVVEIAPGVQLVNKNDVNDGGGFGIDGSGDGPGSGPDFGGGRRL